MARNENPLVRADQGASGAVVAWWRDSQENTETLADLQAAVLVRRLRLSPPVAKVVVEQHFGMGVHDT